MKITFDKVNLSMTKDDKKYLIIHGFIIAVSLFVTSYFITIFYRSFDIVVIGELVVISIILISLLDCLNVIEIRRTVARHTKCAICGAVDESAVDLDEDDPTVVKKTIIDTEIDEKTDSSVVVKTDCKPIPARPLTGFVVNNKVVCLDCIKVMKGIAEKWQ